MHTYDLQLQVMKWLHWIISVAYQLVDLFFNFQQCSLEDIDLPMLFQALQFLYILKYNETILVL